MSLHNKQDEPTELRGALIRNVLNNWVLMQQYWSFQSLGQEQMKL